VSLLGTGFCIRCGVRLDPGHRYCWSCGATRYEAPAGDEASQRPPPTPGVQPFALRERTQQPANLGWLHFFFAAGAVFWLIRLAQSAAVVAAPAGREQLAQQLSGSGVPAANLQLALVASSASALLVAIAAAALHGVAFYGLRARRRWGWAAAVIVAGLWSLVLIGIPFLYVLLKRNTRRVYGLD
jgi:hypothetical protein